jgi:hypothetical protein
MSNRLERLEARLEHLIEGTMARLTAGGFSLSSLASQLAQVMEEGLRVDPHGLQHAPDHYAIRGHPETWGAMLGREPRLQELLAAGLRQVAESQDLRMPRPPQVNLEADPAVPPGAFQVVAWHSTHPLERTHALRVVETQESAHLTPEGAYLIIAGENHFPLQAPVVNLGRAAENQVVLTSPYVSRHHAQLRVRHGRYVLFDLGSKGGTIVNGRRVRQHVLRPGDVISMGGIELIYGEDPGPHGKETGPFTPAMRRHPPAKGED